MVQINFARKEVNCKIVYYGPGLSGKTTNLEIVHEKAPADRKGDLTSIATEGDRTLFFDFMPLELGKVGGMNTKFQLYTVPGQVYYNATRKLVLQGSDGIVFVAHSQRDKLDENLESLKNLEENLKEQGLDIKKLPVVLQYNKRDLPGAMAVVELDKALNKWGHPTFEAVAVTGEGVFPTLKALSSMVLATLNKQYGVGTKAAVPKPAAPPAAVVGAGSESKKLDSGELPRERAAEEREKVGAGAGATRASASASVGAAAQAHAPAPPAERTRSAVAAGAGAGAQPHAPVAAGGPPKISRESALASGGSRSEAAASSPAAGTRAPARGAHDETAGAGTATRAAPAGGTGAGRGGAGRSDARDRTGEIARERPPAERTPARERGGEDEPRRAPARERDREGAAPARKTGGAGGERGGSGGGASGGGAGASAAAIAKKQAGSATTFLFMGLVVALAVVVLAVTGVLPKLLDKVLG